MVLIRCKKCNYKFNHPEKRGPVKSCPYCNSRDGLVYTAEGGVVRDVDEMIRELE